MDQIQPFIATPESTTTTTMQIQTELQEPLLDFISGCFDAVPERASRTSDYARRTAISILRGSKDVPEVQ